VTWRQGEAAAAAPVPFGRILPPLAAGVALPPTGADGVDAPPPTPAVPVALGAELGLAGALAEAGADVAAWPVGLLLACVLGAALVAWPPPVWVRLGAGLSEPFGRVTMPGLLDGTVVFTPFGLVE